MTRVHGALSRPSSCLNFGAADNEIGSRMQGAVLLPAHSGGAMEAASYHGAILAAVVASEAEATGCSPLLYAGLRLLQLGSRQQAGRPHSPIEWATRAPSPELLPSPTTEAAGERFEPSGDKLSPELALALKELQQLREKLNRAEVAEAVQAAKVIEIANDGLAVRAARYIQASYHGHVARSWARDVRMDAAATSIQAAYHGSYARRCVRAEIGAESERRRAANAIQAATHGHSARSYCRGLRAEARQ